MGDKKVEWTNPITNEKFIHKPKKDGTTDFLYGPKDNAGKKNHRHAVIDKNRKIIFNRNPKGE